MSTNVFLIFNNIGKELYYVTASIFYDYIRRYQLKETPANTTHGNNYVDPENVVKAYRESSFWGASIIYQIADDTYQNLETVNLLTNILNK